jgi:hypothetical protein
MNRHIFQIGEKVISLTNAYDELSQPRIKGNLYLVKDILYCIKCGEQSINVGPKLNLDIFLDYTDCKCGVDNLPCFGLHWTDSVNFIRPEHLEGLMLEKANEEDYESAAEIKEMIETFVNT